MDNSKNRGGSDPLAVMLEARSVALVGASPRPGSLGARMIEEAAKSPSRPRTYLVNPRYGEIGGSRCYPGLADLPEPGDLDAVIAAIVSFSALVTDVGDRLSAFDLNPLICSPSGPLAVDALAELAPPSPAPAPPQGPQRG